MSSADPDGRSDRSLVEAWRTGDRVAGDALLRRHVHAVRRFLERSGGPVDDLLQETLLQCLRAMDKFRGNSTFRTFAFAVASNVRRDHARRALRTPVPSDAIVTELVDGADDPEAWLDASRASLALDESLVVLRPREREMIRMQYWEDLSSSQIAGALHVPAGTVRRQQMAAKRTLAKAVRARLLKLGRRP